MRYFKALVMWLFMCVCGCSVIDLTQEEGITCHFYFLQGFSGQHVALFINNNQIMNKKELLTIEPYCSVFTIDAEVVKPKVTVKLIVDDNSQFFSINTNDGVFFRVYIIGAEIDVEQSHYPVTGAEKGHSGQSRNLVIKL